MAADSRTLTEILVELYRRLSGEEPGPDLLTAIQELREDNGLVEQEQVPAWLTAALEAALAGREVRPVLFPEIGSDVGSFLIELSEIIPGWQHDNQGEWVTMSFPALGVQIHLSREARTPEGVGCSSYSVRRLAPAE